MATFITYVLTGGVLDAGKAFTAMSLLNIIRFPMNMLPMLVTYIQIKKGKGSQYSITERMVPELIPVLGSQPAGEVSHKPDCRLPLFSARPAVTPATLKRAATSFAAL